VLFATLLGVIHAQVINIDANGDPSAAANAIKDAIAKAGGGGGGAEAALADDTNDGSSNVTTLTDANFESSLNDGSIWLVEFYAPWCGHCKQLAPEYENAADTLKEVLGDKVKLGKMDATADDANPPSKYDVSGYPTLVFMKDGTNGDHYPYEGGRLAANFVDHMKDVESGAWKPPIDRVVTLTNDSFDDFVKGEKITLVEFYAPWCGHCKKLAPDYTKAAGILWPEIKIAKVDATVHAELGTRFGVTGYPALKVFNGNVDSSSDYEGERDPQSIAQELRDLTGDAAKRYDTIFETEQQTEPQYSGDEHFVMGWFESEDDAAYKLYQEAAMSIRKQYRFGYTTNPDVIANYGGAKAGTITAFKSKFYLTKYDTSATSLNLNGGEETVAAVKAWIADSTWQLLQKIDPAAKIAKASHQFTGRPLLTFYADLPTDKDFRAESAATIASIAEVAAKFKGRVQFTHADASDATVQTDMASTYKIADQDQEVKAVFLGEGKESKYVMEDDGDLETFVTAALAGDLTPYVKTEPKPKKNKGPVKVVVGSTFNAIVNDESNDVLIEFYAPWCGHCKSLDPIYKKTAKKLKDVEGVVLAKIDATANDYPGVYEVSGFPTIYFAAKGKKDAPTKYDGDRDQKGFFKFLREHSSADIPKPKKKKGAKKAKKQPDDAAATADAAAAPAEGDLGDDYRESDDIPKDEL